MRALPPGYVRKAITDYRPAGCPKPGSVWYIDTTTGAATTVFTDETEAIDAAWQLHDRLARMLQPKRLTEIGLFAGIGGFQLGFQQAGIETVALVEIDRAAQDVLRRHFSDVPILSDVREVGRANLPDTDILSFGFPCQDLSLAGNRRGLAGARSSLFYEATRIADELRPMLLCWENVPGLLSSDDGRDFMRVLMELERIGYAGCWTCLDAQFFGLAQRRQRIFGVFARRDIGAAVCAEILSLVARLPWNSQTSRAKRARVAAAVAASAGHHGRSSPRGDGSDNLITFDTTQITSASNYSTPRAGEPCHPLSATAHAPAVAAIAPTLEGGTNRTGGTRPPETVDTAESLIPVLCGALSAAQGGPDDNSAQANRLIVPLLEIGKRTNGGHHSGDGIGGDGDPMYTLQAGAQHGIGAAFGVRRLTPLECERLQGFEDGWTAEGATGPQADSARYRQLGNAVAVPVARWIGRQIVKFLG